MPVGWIPENITCGRDGVEYEGRWERMWTGFKRLVYARERRGCERMWRLRGLQEGSIFFDSLGQRWIGHDFSTLRF